MASFIKAKIIADSISPENVRITTFVLKYPRFVHSEMMTHRMVSKNSASSRAIPTKRMLSNIINDPAMPVEWGKNQAGMQAKELMFGWRETVVKFLWLAARWPAVIAAWIMSKLGLHKQIVNRLLEPWMWMEIIATATDWDNFYALRDHPAAQPEMQELARVMLNAHNDSNPVKLEYGQWHLPFVEPREVKELGNAIALKLSVARCCRVSYLNHEGKRSTSKEDLALYNRLLGSAPLHASPSEHQATPMASISEYSGNLRGWKQYRKSLINENIKNYKGFKK